MTKPSNISLAVGNNLNNYVESNATAGDLKATLVLNTIDNNVNVNSPSIPTNASNWSAPVDPNSFFNSGWSNVVRGPNDSTDAGHRRLSISVVEGLLDQV